MRAILTVPIFGSSRQKTEEDKGRTTQNIDVMVRRASLTKNDHNQADELDISFEWMDGGVDPRFLKNATIDFYVGDAVSYGSDDIPLDHTTLRFVGVAIKVTRIGKDDTGFVVDMTFKDYTYFFLKSKPFPAEGYPLFSDKLSDAWERVCDHTGWEDPSVEGDNKIVSCVTDLRDSIVFEGNIDTSRTLGSVVPKRYAKLGKYDSSIERTADAWTVWSRCVGSLGLITFIDRDQCVVTTSAAYYIDDPNNPDRPKPPKMIWGKNILSLEETAHGEFEGKGVCITSYDYNNETTLEAYWPPRDQKHSPILTKRVVAHKLRKGESAADQAIQTNRYDFIEYNGVTDQGTLLAIAQRAYDERSRQELTGTVRTSEFFIDASLIGNVSTKVDILSLRSGDEIQIAVDPFNREVLSSISNRNDRVAYLVSKGYKEDIANLIVMNMEAFSSLQPTYHVRGIHMNLDSDADGGNFEVDISFCNRIQVDGEIKNDEDIRVQSVSTS